MIFDFCMVFHVSDDFEVLNERTLIIISVLRNLGLVAKVYRGYHGAYIYVLIRRKYSDCLNNSLNSHRSKISNSLSNNSFNINAKKKALQNSDKVSIHCTYGQSNIFSESDRLKLTHQIIESTTEDGQRIKLRYYIVRKKFITACFPLHDIPRLLALRSTCLRLWSIPLGLPLVRIKVKREFVQRQ